VPFTPSHVAAVLPFARTPLVPSALVIGSMGPDLFYYVPLPIERSFTHSLTGVFTVDLVLGVVLFVLWQLLFRRPTIDFLPLVARSRLSGVAFAGSRLRRMAWWRAVVLVLASVILGTITHVLWDSFTHGGAVVNHIPALLRDWAGYPVYKWAQWGSTVFGAVAVVLWGIAWLRKMPQGVPAPSPLAGRTRSIARASTVSVGMTVSLAIWFSGIQSGQSAFESRLDFLTATIGIAAAALALTAWSIAWWLIAARSSAVRR
jgi:hypothetical protein